MVDWWSVGIIIYEMFLGQPTFKELDNPRKVCQNILKNKFEIYWPQTGKKQISKETRLLI